MINMTNQFILIVSIVSFFLGADYANAQDSIKVDDLRQFAFPFDIEDGVLTGKGAEVLTKAVSNAHVVMLGNNSRNQLEADLDLALSRVLDHNGYNTLMMEIGPASAGIVNRLTSQSKETLEVFRQLNQDYHFEAGGLLFTSIPDFKYVGASQLTEFVKTQGWSFDGIGVDSWTGYKLIIDELYRNLSAANQKVHQELYQKSVALLDRLYADIKGQNYDDILALTSGLKSSGDFNQFLVAMSSFDVNTEMLKQFKFSLDYWWMYGNKEAFTKNKLSSKRNKALMKDALEKVHFSFRDDKLFLKMWRGHLTNGVTRNGFYGIGNMLMELSDYHGNESLNIGILDSRFSMEDNVLKDAIDNPNGPPEIHRPFVALGEQSKWMLIDLRPFNETFYWGNYIQTLEFRVMMRRFDFIIIPKIDRKAIVNN